MNLASGATRSIKDAAQILAKAADCEIEWDAAKPTGQSTRAYDTSILQTAGWAPEWSLERGLDHTIRWYAMNEETARKNSP